MIIVEKILEIKILSYLYISITMQIMDMSIKNFPKIITIFYYNLKSSI